MLSDFDFFVLEFFYEAAKESNPIKFKKEIAEIQYLLAKQDWLRSEMQKSLFNDLVN